MITILGRVKIQDLAVFVSVFATQGATMRKYHGSESAQLFKIAATPLEVIVLFNWSSREDFERFVDDPTVKETMKASGTLGPPEFTILEVVGNFPA